MKCIDELQKIGIDKVSAKTRITQDKIQDIVNLKFDSFNKARARGFKQIIEREFGVDLSEWFDAYNDYHSTNNEQSDEVEQGVDEITKNINIPIDSDKKNNSYLVLVALLAVLVVLFVSFFIYNNFLNTSDKFTKQSTSTPFQNIQQNNISADSSQETKDLQDDSAQESRADNDLVDSSNLVNPTNPNPTNQNDDLAQNDSADMANPNANQITTNPAPISTTSIQIASQSEELIITPNEPLWVGVIDLKSNRKKQLSIASRHAITLDGDKLIRTGHSYFGVNIGTNFAKQYIGGDNKYFIYRVDSGLREISKAEFLELNKGQEW